MFLYVSSVSNSIKLSSGNHKNEKPYLVNAKLGRCSRCPASHAYCHNNLCVKSCNGRPGCGKCTTLQTTICQC